MTSPANAMALERHDVKGRFAGGVSMAHETRELSSIRMSECAAVIWHRRPSPACLKWIGALAREHLPRTRVILRPDAIRQAAIIACEAAGTPDCTERRCLVDDIAQQAEIFAALMRAPCLRMRLDVVTTNACRKFHVDAVTARLVCTFRGTGTQYGISTGAGDPKPVHTVPTGSPILLRGTLWPTRSDRGFLHRSPPIEGTGETRLVLVLDPIFDTEEEI